RSSTTRSHSLSLFFPFPLFFFNDTATSEIYTLSLHDALPIWNLKPLSRRARRWFQRWASASVGFLRRSREAVHAENMTPSDDARSEEHTSELQSLTNLVCRLLLEKKKTQRSLQHHTYTRYNTP